jgi:phosphoribosylaminoimidazolecarboxamide formyltransferase/IMP cyclohydrolase
MKSYHCAGERAPADADRIRVPRVHLRSALFSFSEATVAKGADFATCIENVDIGGPSMLRSSAKNHNFVTIATDPAQYAELIAELRANGGQTSLALRKRFAARAFALSAGYDAAIASWFNEQLAEDGAHTTVSRAYTHEAELKYDGCDPLACYHATAPPGAISSRYHPLGSR